MQGSGAPARLDCGVDTRTAGRVTNLQTSVDTGWVQGDVGASRYQQVGRATAAEPCAWRRARNAMHEVRTSMHALPQLRRVQRRSSSGTELVRAAGEACEGDVTFRGVQSAMAPPCGALCDGDQLADTGEWPVVMSRNGNGNGNGHKSLPPQ